MKINRDPVYSISISNRAIDAAKKFPQPWEQLRHMSSIEAIK
mgnify:CR=1 FL=1